MALVLLKSKGKMLTKWLSEQFWRCCSSIYVLLEYIIKYNIYWLVTNLNTSSDSIDNRPYLLQNFANVTTHLDSPVRWRAVTALCWRAAARCLCWWWSGRTGRPCGEVCSGTFCTRCGHSPGWWACGGSPRRFACRWDTTETPSIAGLARAL